MKKEKANGLVYFWSTIVFETMQLHGGYFPTSDTVHLSQTPRDSEQAERMGTKGDFHRKQGSQPCPTGRWLPLWSAAAGCSGGRRGQMRELS